MLERDWSQTEALSFEYQLTSISSACVVTWVVSDTIFNAIVNGHKLILPCKMTTVLEKRRNKWFIVHEHFSYPNEENFLFTQGKNLVGNCKRVVNTGAFSKNIIDLKPIQKVNNNMLLMSMSVMPISFLFMICQL